jgi:hypothetical protein
MTLSVSGLHILVRIIDIPENLKCQKDAHLLPTFISTRLTTNQPNGTNFGSTDHLSPINSMTVQTFCDSPVNHAHVDTKLEIAIDPIHTEVTDQFSAIAFLIGMLIPISFTRCNSSKDGDLPWVPTCTFVQLCMWKNESVLLVLRYK